MIAYLDVTIESHVIPKGIYYLIGYSIYRVGNKTGFNNKAHQQPDTSQRVGEFQTMPALLSCHASQALLINLSSFLKDNVLN